MTQTDFQPAPNFHALPAKKRRKAPWIIAGAVTLLVIGAAAGGSGKDAPTPAPTASTAAPTAAVSTPAPRAIPGQGKASDSYYVAFVRRTTTHLSAVTDSEIVGLAISTCGAFERGGSGREVIRAIIDNSAPSMHEDMATIIGAGVRNYCPEYTFD